MNRRKFLQALAAIGVAPVAAAVMPEKEDVVGTVEIGQGVSEGPCSFEMRVGGDSWDTAMPFSCGDDPDVGWFCVDPVTGELRRIGDDGWGISISNA